MNMRATSAGLIRPSSSPHLSRHACSVTPAVLGPPAVTAIRASGIQALPAVWTAARRYGWTGTNLPIVPHGVDLAIAWGNGSNKILKF